MYSPHESIPEYGEQPAESAEAVSEIEEARAVVSTNNFEEALVLLEKAGLLAGQVSRIKERCESILSKNLSLRLSDWEMLTVLELYDVDTFEHSLRVHEAAVTALERPLTLDNGAPFHLHEYLAEEGVTKHDFIYAALFHDIGKTMIPYCILKDTTTKEEFDRCFCDYATQEGEEWLRAVGIDSATDATTALEELYTQHRRPIDVLPLQKVLKAEVFATVQNTYPYLNISDKTTFREVMMLHEKESERILRKCDQEVSATIAGQHHNYARLPLVYPRSTSTLRLARVNAHSKLSDILHIVDVSDAIKNTRSYKNAQSDYLVLHELIVDTNAGAIDPRIAHAWVRAEYENIVVNHTEILPPEDLAVVNEFLSTPVEEDRVVV